MQVRLAGLATVDGVDAVLAVFLGKVEQRQNKAHNRGTCTMSCPCQCALLIWHFVLDAPRVALSDFVCIPFTHFLLIRVPSLIAHWHCFELSLFSFFFFSIFFTFYYSLLVALSSAFDTNRKRYRDDEMSDTGKEEGGSQGPGRQERR